MPRGRSRCRGRLGAAGDHGSQGHQSGESPLLLLNTQVELGGNQVSNVKGIVDAVDGVTDANIRSILDRLRSLYALATLEQHKGWYLEHGYFDGVKTKAIRRAVDALCTELRPDAGALVDAFSIPDQVLAAPLAQLSKPVVQD